MTHGALTHYITRTTQALLVKGPPMYMHVIVSIIGKTHICRQMLFRHRTIQLIHVHLWWSYEFVRSKFTCSFKPIGSSTRPCDACADIQKPTVVM